MSGDSVTVRVRRGSPEAPARIETFAVPYREGMSVLDAVMWVHANVDSTLAIRYSCINANACKECMVQVDGKTEYACTARLGAAGALIEPLSNKPLIRDLVTNIVPPKERLAAHLAGPGFPSRSTPG